MMIETMMDAVDEQELRISPSELEIGWFSMAIGFTRGFQRQGQEKALD